MCGIAGLFLKDSRLEPELGATLSKMLEILSDRGPDSAGFAIYGDASAGNVKLSVLLPEDASVDVDLAAVRQRCGDSVNVEANGNALILTMPEAEENLVRSIVTETLPDANIIGSGSRMEVFKAVGLPAVVNERFKLPAMGGTHAVGHTRMATESAVSPLGAHPFSTGRDQCLVHNGSLSNNFSLKRWLTRNGIEVETENDSEVAAAYLTWRMREGASLAEALEAALVDLDGFFTFVVGTETGFAVLRDPIACKPAVMAETDAYVAFGSEYRALADLPGIEQAKVWEPEPATVYSWERN